MEQQPIKRNKHILQFSKDHHFTLLFSWKLRQGVKNKIDPERIKKYVQYFWDNDIQVHFREEDEILFKSAKDSMVEKAKDDHKQINELIENILKTSHDSKQYEKILVLADTVDSHIRYEERELFPHMERILTEVQMKNISEQLEKQLPLKDDYADEFWVKAYQESEK